MSWKVSVLTGGRWVENALRFATGAEAADYMSDLTERWTAVTQTCAIRTSDAVNAAYSHEDGVTYLNPAGISLSPAD